MNKYNIDLFNSIPKPDSIMMSYNDDKKVLLFCASQLNDKVLYDVDNNTKKLRDEFKKEMSDFGDYVLLLTADELIYRMKKLIDRFSTVFLKGSVTYRNRNLEDFSSEENFNDIYFPYDNPYDPFFVKDNKHKWQNEWRMILQDENGKISKPCGNGVIVNLGKLDWADLFETNKFLETFTIYNK